MTVPFAGTSLSNRVTLIIPISVSVTLRLCVSPPPAGDRGQPEQHAVPRRVRPLLRALVPGVGDGPPDPADPRAREGPHAPLAPHRLGVPRPEGRAPIARQEGRLNVREDTTQN